MLTYHAQMSPRLLTTAPENITTGYPKRWELMRWYLCWRKYPYPSEVIACIVAEARPEEYAHYPCPLDPTHWHIGRGGGGHTSKQRYIQAKRVFRKAVRDEIRDEILEQRANVVQQQQEERERERAGSTGALVH